MQTFEAFVNEFGGPATLWDNDTVNVIAGIVCLTCPTIALSLQAVVGHADGAAAFQRSIDAFTEYMPTIQSTPTLEKVLT